MVETVAAPLIRINTLQCEILGIILITFKRGTTTSRGPVDRRLISLYTLRAANNPSHARLEAILGASQAKTARHRPIKLVL